MDSNEEKSETLSKSKRTFVVGVVDTSGMKSSGTARKRRWDQPPAEGEEVDGVAPAKVAIKEAAAPLAEPSESEESIEDELKEIFVGVTSETLLEGSPVEIIETDSEPAVPTACDPPDAGSLMETCAEVSSSIDDGPEKVTPSTSENDLKLSTENIVEEVEVPSETLPVQNKNTVPGEEVKETPAEEKKKSVREISPKSQNKKESKTVAPVIISDSLKAIQFCYDEDDSNSSECSDDEGTTAIIPAADDAKTDENEEPNVEWGIREAAVVTVEPSLASDTPEEETTSADTTTDFKDEVLIEPSGVSELSQADVIIEHSSVPAELHTRDKSRSPTPVLVDEQDDDSVEQATVLDNAAVGSGEAQVVEVCTVEEITSVVEDTAIIVDEGESAVITDEPLVDDVLQGNSEIYEMSQPGDECVVEPGLTADAVVIQEGGIDVAKVEDDVKNEFSLDVNDRPAMEESGSCEASQTEASVKGLGKIDDSFNDKSLMDLLDAQSEQSEASKPIVEPTAGKEHPVQDQTNPFRVSMDNSQNCCVSFDDMSNLDKTSSKSPELDLRYTDSEGSDGIKNSNPEVTMHFASVRTQDSVQTPDSAQEEAEELKDESALAIDALISANPELDGKPLEFEEQTQSQTTMEMLDSLVRRSSEDDPSRLRQGGGLFSEDSLINEINQLPDQDDTQGSNKSTRKYNASIKVDREHSAVVMPNKPAETSCSEVIVTETKGCEPVADVLDTPIPTTVSAPSQEMEKSETCTSIEEELSLGGDEESKNVTVSSANILEVIFGSEQKSSSYPTITSLEGEVVVRAEKTIQGEPSSKVECVKPSLVSGKPVNDSKLQLKNDDFEMGSAEIVAVDPTKSLSGEDSDEDEVTSLKQQKPQEKVICTQKTLEPKTDEDDESMQVEEEFEKIQSIDISENITVEDVPLTENPEVLESKSIASEPEKAVDDSLALETDVNKSSTSSDDSPEVLGAGKTRAESMEVATDTSVPAVGKPSREEDVLKPAEPLSSTVKKSVPVLIIKKQSLPSKKLGETVETLLTCSPKSMEDIINTSPSIKPPNESLHVDTVQDSAVAESSSPKHSPITLRIYKDNLSVKTDLDSPKRNKSPLASDFKSELSPRSGVSDTVSPQNKQLEFTLKIAKDANTNQPKATMSPKHVASPTSVWKSEVHVDEKPSRSVSATTIDKQPRTVAAEKQQKSIPAATPEKSSRATPAASGRKQLHPSTSASTGKQTRADTVPMTDEQPCPVPVTKVEKQPSTVSIPAVEEELPIDSEPVVERPLLSALPISKPAPTRGRGRGRGSTPRRTPGGRGRRGGAVGLRGKSDEPIVIPDEDASVVEIKTEAEESSLSSAPPTLGLQMTDAFKKMMNQEKASLPQPEVLQPPPKAPTVVEVVTPVVKKRGRPRKSVQQVLPVPEEMVPIKTEPVEPITPADVSGSEAGEDTPSGRPKRTCRGRTKPIVVKKKRGGAAGSVVPRGTSTPLPIDPADIKQEGTPAVVVASTTIPTTPTSTPDTPASGAASVSSPEKPIPQTPVPTPSARGRGNFKRPTPDRNTLSEKELAELQKIEAKKEKLRLDRIAKYEAKKAKKLAKKLKDEERRKRQAQEKADKAAAAAPQVFEEETRMSAPDSSSRGHTPAPNRIITACHLGSQGDTMTIGDESQNSTTTPGDSNRGNKKGRMEIAIGDLDCLVKEVKVDDLAEYQWQGSELFMIQEQVSLYLGVKSFKRKYPGLKRRTVEAEERTFLEDSGLVPKSMCDLGITAVSSAEILDIMFQDFPDKYEEFRKHVRDKQAKEASYKQKAAIGLQKKDGTKVEPREQALEAVASWNANLNRERREERKCALDLQTFTVHYPKVHREHMAKPTPKVGLYPVAVIPGQFCDFYKNYTPTELMYFPINTVLYGPLKPNERQKDGSEDGSASESSSSSSSSSSSGESSSESESEGEDPPKCTMCNGTKKKNKESLPEVLLSCILCKTCYHPSCKEFTPEMTPHLVKYEWQCTACKKCSKCRDPNLKDRIMCCQLCDRGYHLSCIGLKKMPDGRWHCTVCAYCSSCGSRNPGGSDWQHEFKKGEKGTKVYQRTLCTPCFKLWRKGKYCQLCSKCHSMKPEDDPNLIQCNSCDRWLHKECYGTKYGIQNKLLSTSSIQCDICVERIQNSSISGLNRSLIKV